MYVNFLDVQRYLKINRDTTNNQQGQAYTQNDFETSIYDVVYISATQIKIENQLITKFLFSQDRCSSAGI